AGFGIPLALHRRVREKEIGDGVSRNTRLVQPQEGDAFAIRRPRISAGSAGDGVELLVVNPIKDAIQERLAAVKGELGLASRSDVTPEQVCLAHEGDAPAIRRPGDDLSCFAILGQPPNAPAWNVDNMKITAARDENRRTVGRPLVAGDGEA